MDALGVARAVLVGNSFGGGVALRVAAVAPERLLGLVLVSTPPVPLNPSPELQKAWDDEEAALEKGDIDAAVSAVVDAWTQPDAPEALRQRVARMQRRAFEHQLGVIPNAGHLAPLEQPEAFHDLLLEYLQAHAPIEGPRV